MDIISAPIVLGKYGHTCTTLIESTITIERLSIDNVYKRTVNSFMEVQKKPITTKKCLPQKKNPKNI